MTILYKERKWWGVYSWRCIINAINFHNNNKHSNTGFKPADLKEVEDINIINQVNDNIKKKYFKSYKI